MLKKRYKSVIQRKKREHQNRIRDELENFHSANQNDFWRFWDKLKQHNSTTTPRGKLTLQTFESYFSSIQNPPDGICINFDSTSLHSARSLIAIQDFENGKSLHITDCPITIDEVDKQIKNLKLKKAPGINGISNEFFKCASCTLLKQGFGGKLVKILMSMFSKANARVRWEGQLGEKFDSKHGVLQGGIISPKLFNFFLADLDELLDQNHGVKVNMLMT